jgi:putative flippase GtrA
MVMRQPELHLALRFVIVGITMTLILASTIWQQRVR